LGLLHYAFGSQRTHTEPNGRRPRPAVEGEGERPFAGILPVATRRSIADARIPSVIAGEFRKIKDLSLVCISMSGIVSEVQADQRSPAADLGFRVPRFVYR
jgi:hypothetical protein